MDTQQNNALSRALAEVPGPLPASGVVHLVIPHTSRFTVVGNHLAQHRELSLVAMALAVHIQSLPRGADVGIKSLAARFAEGETRIAAALRELEAHGYLRRTRVRLPSGRIVTRTVFCNQPGALAQPVPVAQPARTPAPVPTPEPPAPPDPAPPAAQAPAAPATVPTPVQPPAASRPAPPPPLPQPRDLTPELRRAATDLLADLRRHAPQLLLAERDIGRLAPGVAAWLERGARPDVIRHALTGGLPQPLAHPAGLVGHRLAALVPPPLPDVPGRVAAVVVPLVNCDSCDRAFRSTEAGHCRDCRREQVDAAA